jgi:hypothetical protein
MKSMYAASVALGLFALAISDSALAAVRLSPPAQALSETVDPRLIYESIQQDASVTLTDNIISLSVPFFQTVSFASDGNPLSYSSAFSIYTIVNSSTPFQINRSFFSMAGVRMVNSGPVTTDEITALEVNLAVRDLGVGVYSHSAPLTQTFATGSSISLNGVGIKDAPGTAIGTVTTGSYVYAPGINYAIELTLGTTFTQSGLGSPAGYSTGFTLEGGFAGVHNPIALSVYLVPLPELSTWLLLACGLPLLIAVRRSSKNDPGPDRFMTAQARAE